MRVTGVGLWAPGFADAAAWRAGVADPSVARPGAPLIPARQRRRASLLTRALATALGEAAAQAGVDLATTATIFGSAYGEGATLGQLLSQRHEGDGALSPLRFAGSVHNTASGMVSIATGARGFTTSLAAGDDTLVACLDEAAGLLAAGHDAVAVVVGDEAPPAALIPAEQRCAPLAVALVLRRAEAPAGPAAQAATEAPTITWRPATGADALAGARAAAEGLRARAAAAGLDVRYQPCFSALQLLDPLVMATPTAGSSPTEHHTTLTPPPGRLDAGATTWAVTVRSAAAPAQPSERP